MSIIDDIIDTFHETNSVKATAQHNHCSWNRVLKVLSTNGIIVNETHAIILDLYEKGMTVEQIAKQVDYNEKTVKSYLPSVRPYYGVNQSVNAKRIKKYRNRRMEKNA
jgi:DNA-binding NarL/FixJ family response regulator